MLYYYFNYYILIVIILLTNLPFQVVVTCALRSAITKAKKGGFKDTGVDEILKGVLEGIRIKSGIDPKLVEDIVIGTVTTPGGGANLARAAALAAGYPDTTGLSTLNRQCSSGLMACVQIAHEIQSGMIDIGIGGGFESMSQFYGAAGIAPMSESVAANKDAQDCTIPMGLTSENVAKEFNISRDAQDEFAASSYQKAEYAQKNGLFDEEIWPIETNYVDPKTGKTSRIVVKQDDGIRYGTTKESLAKIKPAFKADGTTHAGNASQVSDGAAAVLLMRRSVAEKLGQKIIGKYVAASVVGVPPRIMGIGPAVAIPMVLKKTGLSVNDVDIYEINEAFASQCLYSAQAVGIDMKKLNPKGGAIAFGHPLGVSGARQVSTLLTELKRTNEKIGVTSMCIGGGQGMAAVWVNEA